MTVKERYDIKPRLTSTGKPKRGGGYDVFLVSPTGRVWIGWAPLKAEAEKLRAGARNGRMRR